MFVAARDSERSFRGLTGTDRFFLYLTAAGTGFRAIALANLIPIDFDLNANSPTVTLAARFNKSRKLKVQPLPPDVANALCDYLKDRPSNTAVWGGTWARDHRGAEMIRIDLEAAGIAYSVEGPDGPEYADFHALRHSFLTLGGRSGIDLRTLQELAGHSKPELTARYSHRRLYDLAGAVDMLPNLVPSMMPQLVEIPLRMTGTGDTFGVVPGVVGVVPGVVKGGIPLHQSASLDNNQTVSSTGSASRKPRKRQGPALESTGPHQSASARATGFEPATTGATVRYSNQLSYAPMHWLYSARFIEREG